MNGHTYPLLYTALGDSLTVGKGSSLFTPGFVPRYASLSEYVLGQTIYVEKFARKGATTAEILNFLNYSEVLNNINRSQLITITAGGNDLLKAGKRFLINRNEEEYFPQIIQEAVANIHRMIEIIQYCKQNDQNYFIKVFDLYNPVPQISVSDYWIGQYNSLLNSAVTRQNVEVIDIYGLFRGNEKSLLSWDHVHPNNLGYEKMAQALYQSGYYPLLR